jgi:hypothetical protein
MEQTVENRTLVAPAPQYDPTMPRMTTDHALPAVLLSFKGDAIAVAGTRCELNGRSDGRFSAPKVTWVVTVRSEMKSLVAIWGRVSPSATSRAISSSSRVRMLGGWLAAELVDAAAVLAGSCSETWANRLRTWDGRALAYHQGIQRWVTDLNRLYAAE